MRRSIPVKDPSFPAANRERKNRRKRGEGFRVRARAFRSGRYLEAAKSVNWLGYFGEDDQFALQRVCETTTYQGIDQRGRFVKLKSVDIRKIYIESFHTNLSAYFTPSRFNVSHTEIRPSGDAVFTALAAHAERYGSLLDVPPLEDSQVRL